MKTQIKDWSIYSPDTSSYQAIHTKRRCAKLGVFLLIIVAIFIIFLLYNVENRQILIKEYVVRKNSSDTMLTIDQCNDEITITLDKKILAKVKRNERETIALVINKYTRNITFWRTFNIIVWFEHADELENILGGIPKHRIVIIITTPNQLHAFNDKIDKILKMKKIYKNTKNHNLKTNIIVYDNDDQMVLFDTKHNIKKTFNGKIECYTDTYIISDSLSIMKLPKSFKNTTSLDCPQWPNTKLYQRRAIFCSKYDSYHHFCKCNDPNPIDFEYKPLLGNQLTEIDTVLVDTPIIIIASKRPFYLIRCLYTLLNIRGVNVDNVHVYMDNSIEENTDITKLFGVKYTISTNECEHICGSATHYRKALTHAFKFYQSASEVIILEEDLDVAPDFMLYMAEMIPFLRKNKKFYCVSAWNDQSYLYSLGDPKGVFKTDFMPGLGWAFPKSIFHNELLPYWDRSPASIGWDYWFRDNKQRKDRECIVPDISRTYHYGLRGNTMYPSLHRDHFVPRPNVPFYINHFNLTWLINNSYDELLTSLIRRGKIINSIDDVYKEFKIDYSKYKKHPFSPLIYHQLNMDGYSLDELIKITSVIFIKINNSLKYTWLKICREVKLFDMDVRDFYSDSIRLWFNQKHFYLIMCPKSKFCELKPEEAKIVDV